MRSDVGVPEMKDYIDRVIRRRDTGDVLTAQECQDILKYAADNKSDAVLGIGYYYFAEAYWFQGNQNKTMYCLTECAKCFQATEMHEFLARTYNMMGAVSDRLDNKVVALNYYYTGFQYAEKYQLGYALGLTGLNIGYTMARMRRFEEAVRYYDRAIDGFRSARECRSKAYNLALARAGLGSCCIRMGDTERAQQLLAEIDEVRKEYPEKQYPDMEIEIFRGECFAAQGERQKALQCAEKVMLRFEEIESLNAVAGSLINLVELLLCLKECKKLEKVFQKADALGLEKEPNLAMELYPYRGKCLLNNGRTEDYIHYTKQYFAAYEKDCINNKQVTARLMELQDRFRSLQKERERMRTSNRELETLALYDSMTNLANRTLISEYGLQKFEDAQSNSKLLGVEMLDIDYFKSYNDTYGHLAGDVCIGAVAEILREIRDDRIFCGRYGGDEFVVIYSDMTAEEIEKVVLNIQKQVREKKIPHAGSSCSDIVTVSQGVFVRLPSEENKEWDFNFMADIALYRAKREGRNCYHIATAFQEREEKYAGTKI